MFTEVENNMRGQTNFQFQKLIKNFNFNTVCTMGTKFLNIKVSVVLQMEILQENNELVSHF